MLVVVFGHLLREVSSLPCLTNWGWGRGQERSQLFLNRLGQLWKRWNAAASSSLLHRPLTLDLAHPVGWRSPKNTLSDASLHSLMSLAAPQPLCIARLFFMTSVRTKVVTLNVSTPWRDPFDAASNFCQLAHAHELNSRMKLYSCSIVWLSNFLLWGAFLRQNGFMNIAQKCRIDSVRSTYNCMYIMHM